LKEAVDNRRCRLAIEKRLAGYGVVIRLITRRP